MTLLLCTWLTGNTTLGRPLELCLLTDTCSFSSQKLNPQLLSYGFSTLETFFIFYFVPPRNEKRVRCSHIGIDTHTESSADFPHITIHMKVQYSSSPVSLALPMHSFVQLREWKGKCFSKGHSLLCSLWQTSPADCSRVLRIILNKSRGARVF